MIKVTLRDTTTQEFPNTEALEGYLQVRGYEVTEINIDGEIEKPTWQRRDAPPGVFSPWERKK